MAHGEKLNQAAQQWHSRVGMLVNARSIAVLATLLAFGLRIHNLDTASLWIDEGYTLHLSQQPVREILQNIVPSLVPAHYFVLHWWIQLVGISEFALRFVSVWFGVIMVPLAYVLGAKLINHKTGSVAALLTAISPFLIYQSQQARQEIIGVAFALFSFYFFVSWVVAPPPSQKHRWYAPFGFVLSTALGFYTFYFVAFTSLVQGVWIVIKRPLWRAHAKSIGVVIGCLVVLVGPWVAPRVSSIIGFTEKVVASNSTLDWWTPPAFRSADQVSVGLAQVVADTTKAFVIGSDTNAILSTVGLVLGAIIVGLAMVFNRKTRWWQHQSALLLGMWVIVPLVVDALLEQKIPHFMPRYVIVAAPAFLVILATAITGTLFSHRQRILAILSTTCALLLGITMLLSAVSYFQQSPGLHEDYRNLAKYITQNARPGDAIILDAKWQRASIDYYLTGDIPIYGVPSTFPLDATQTDQELQQIIDKHSAVWLVSSGSVESAWRGGYVLRWLDSHQYKMVNDRWFGNVRLDGYVPKITDPSIAMANSITAAFTFEDGIRLVGYRVEPKNVIPGETLKVTLFWSALTTPKSDSTAFIHVLSADDKLIAQQDSPPLRGAVKTSTWIPGEIYEDSFGLRIPVATPPGKLDVRLGLYIHETNGYRNLKLVNPQEISPADSVSLGQVKVSPKVEAAIPATAKPASVAFGQQIVLEAYQLTTSQAGKLTIDLYWRAKAPLAVDYANFVHVIGSNDQIEAQEDKQPLGGNYPTSVWEAGELVHDTVTLSLAGDQAGQIPKVCLGWYDPSSGQRLPILTSRDSDGRYFLEGIDQIIR